MDREVLAKANKQLNIIAKSQKQIKTIGFVFKNYSNEIDTESDILIYNEYNETNVKLPKEVIEEVKNVLLNYYNQKIKSAESVIENL